MRMYKTYVMHVTAAALGIRLLLHVLLCVVCLRVCVYVCVCV
jgi:hypothetical protein